MTKDETGPSLWDKRTARGASPLEGVSPRAPSAELVKEMDRAAKAEHDASPFREHVSEETLQRMLP